jgi:hypothetical protein
LTPVNAFPDRFASFFNKKISAIINGVRVDDQVYNGRKRLSASDKMFMDPISVRKVILSLKMKNTEGFDRIPQRVLVDGVEILAPAFTQLFELIYTQCTIPAQWRVAKTIPVFKNKGSPKDIENYRPIANLCSASKIFEKLILKRIMEIQDESRIDLTGANQHGFKKGRSTSALSAELQSIIGHALDENEYLLMASLDLILAFDLVNIGLLLKRMRNIGLPNDVINLASVWLKQRSFYVSIDGEILVLFDLLMGTVQGSILGPVLTRFSSHRYLILKNYTPLRMTPSYLDGMQTYKS